MIKPHPQYPMTYKPDAISHSCKTTRERKRYMAEGCPRGDYGEKEGAQDWKSSKSYGF